eukprot:scaffold36325_cov15-Tisochrysis_lutea.AAC.1
MDASTRVRGCCSSNRAESVLRRCFGDRGALLSTSEGGTVVRKCPLPAPAPVQDLPRSLFPLLHIAHKN